MNIYKNLPSPSKEELEGYIVNGTRHAHYHKTTMRSDIMTVFFDAVEKGKVDRGVLKQIIKQSSVESDKDYERRIERFPIIPFERRFVKSIERIYQGHGVTRRLPEGDFWEFIQSNFDEHGETLDRFFRKNVLVLAQVMGFGGIAVDVATSTDAEGNSQTLTDEKGKPIPYAYLVKPSEIIYYKQQQGVLQFVLVRQTKMRDGKYVHEYRALTSDSVHLWIEQLKQGTKVLNEDEIPSVKGEDLEYVGNFPHDFGEVPFVFVRGESDLSTMFTVGRPARYHLTDLYVSAGEILHDLQESSLLYAHPIPVLSDETVDRMVSASKGDAGQHGHSYETIRAEMGMVIQYTAGHEPPKDIFFQPSMSGAGHLKSYLFDLIDFIHNLANIRDKSKMVANTSGVSKSMDTVEERGLLATTAMQQQTIERKVISLFAKVRGEEKSLKKDFVVYQTEFDLSTAEDLSNAIVQGVANGAWSLPMLKYLTVEFLRKNGAPEDVVNDVEQNFEDEGMPMKIEAGDMASILGDKAVDFFSSKVGQDLEALASTTVTTGEETEFEPVEPEQQPPTKQDD